MLIGNCYRFQKRTLAIRENSERRLLHIPAGSIVSVSSLSEDGRFVRLEWEGTELAVFTQDFVERTLLVQVPPPSEHFRSLYPDDPLNRDRDGYATGENLGRESARFGLT
jgi:hypothetical protein